MSQGECHGRQKSSSKRTFIGAKILFKDGASVLDCIVKDLSEGGGCCVVWRRLTSMGVSFSNPHD
ncbi:hypothetical protein B5K06_25970 [Rhizobium grahamii]|uniref:PilZ domain-containing protein n=1 Tax=Rhizobium grahamii TaxID=1120045 RepID=A0A370KJ83_9HYPH|nr:hypothetical protein B5K06_25970 [Rhizobium grahamii]